MDKIEKELADIQKDVDKFLSDNQTKYKIFSKIMDDFVFLSEENYDENVQYIQDHKDIIFKDHGSTIYFYLIMIRYAEYYFKKFELYLDIIAHFSADIKNAGASEMEMIDLFFRFTNGIYFLYSKNFFSIDTILSQSIFYDFIFINFLPELEEYDKEFVKKTEETFLLLQSDEILNFYQYVKNNRQAHFLNRQLNYHPSPLHKSIRDDDIETFQSLLSKKNYGFNYLIEFSYYERSHTIDNDQSLIQIAAVYGSINIFKFLWIQNDIKLNDNLLKYAYFGRNYEIIHLCEQSCSKKDVYLQPIFIHQQSLLEYYLDNFSDEIKEENTKIESKMIGFVEDENNPFKKLDAKGLGAAISSFYQDIIINCLPKIIYIVKNVDLSEDIITNKSVFYLLNCNFDIELFHFIYSQKKLKFELNEKNPYCDILEECLSDFANDAFKFIFVDAGYDINSSLILFDSIRLNPTLANFILDLQLDEVKNKVADREDSLFSMIKKNPLDFDALLMSIGCFNEDVVVKLLMLYDFNMSGDELSKFISEIINTLSKRMIHSLFNRLTFLSRKMLMMMADLFEDNDYHSVYSLIMNNLPPE